VYVSDVLLFLLFVYVCNVVILFFCAFGRWVFVCVA